MNAEWVAMRNAGGHQGVRSRWWGLYVATDDFLHFYQECFGKLQLPDVRPVSWGGGGREGNDQGLNGVMITDVISDSLANPTLCSLPQLAEISTNSTFRVVGLHVPMSIMPPPPPS